MTSTIRTTLALGGLVSGLFLAGCAGSPQVATRADVETLRGQLTELQNDVDSLSHEVATLNTLLSEEKKSKGRTAFNVDPRLSSRQFESDRWGRSRRTDSRTETIGYEGSARWMLTCGDKGALIGLHGKVSEERLGSLGVECVAEDGELWTSVAPGRDSGDAEKARCPEGHLVVGLGVRTGVEVGLGTRIMAVQPICAPRDESQRGGIDTRDPVPGPVSLGTIEERETQLLRCIDPAAVVTGIDVRLEATGDESPTGAQPARGVRIRCDTIVPLELDDDFKAGAPDLVRTRRNGVYKGLRVTGVPPDSMWSRAGLRKGDVIAEIDDHAVPYSERRFLAYVQHREGEMQLTITRSGQQRTVVLEAPE